MRMRADDMVDANARRGAPFAMACGAAYAGLCHRNVCTQERSAVNLCFAERSNAEDSGDSERFVGGTWGLQNEGQKAHKLARCNNSFSYVSSPFSLQNHIHSFSEVSVSASRQAENYHRQQDCKNGKAIRQLWGSCSLMRTSMSAICGKTSLSLQSKKVLLLLKPHALRLDIQLRAAASHYHARTHCHAAKDVTISRYVSAAEMLHVL